MKAPAVFASLMLTTLISFSALAQNRPRNPRDDGRDNPRDERPRGPGRDDPRGPGRDDPRGPGRDDPRGPGRDERRLACFYEHDNFLGRETCYEMGTVVFDLGAVNDTFSSARIPRGFVVQGYSTENFRGKTMPIQGNIPSLALYGRPYWFGDRYWNDRISSLDLRY